MEKLQIGLILHYTAMNGRANWYRIKNFGKMPTKFQITLAKDGRTTLEK
jgi:hypothetical protein